MAERRTNSKAPRVFREAVSIVPPGEGEIKGGVDGTMDGSGFASQIGNLRNLSTLYNLSMGLAIKSSNHPLY